MRNIAGNTFTPIKRGSGSFMNVISQS